MKVAIVHDWLYGGGAERVVQELHTLYPDAPIYTSFCTDEWRQRLDNKVVTSYMQRQPFRKFYKFLPLLRQWWFRSLDLSKFDLVISSTGNGEAKFVHVPNGKHISYCHTPVHFYWRHYENYLQDPGFKPAWFARMGLKLTVGLLRNRDYKAAQRVDYFIANSAHIKNDIQTYYNRESEVIHPPVDIDRFIPTVAPKKRHGFITMGRQVPMKRFDLVIKACNELNIPLTVIGRGPEHNNLVRIAGPTIIFKTDVTDKQMPNELAKAKAFIFASFEDFGIAPIESMAAGTPVIAYKAGGALDYVVPKITGEFFDNQTTESLIEILSKFNATVFEPNKLRTSASQFSATKFRNKLTKTLINLNSKK